MRMRPFFVASNASELVLSRQPEIATAFANASHQKFRLSKRCKILAVVLFARGDFLTSILPLDILRGSCRAASGVGKRAGGVAQLGERLNGIQEVRGSIPLTSMAEA